MERYAHSSVNLQVVFTQIVFIGMHESKKKRKKLFQVHRNALSKVT